MISETIKTKERLQNAKMLDVDICLIVKAVLFQFLRK